MSDHPSLAEQIAAVEWAETHVEAIRKVAKHSMRNSEADRLIKALEAAAETLRNMEYGSAIAR